MELDNSKKNILVTAWNDSGAGYLMRLLDNASNVNILPFETLLGFNTNIGIKNKSDLIRPSNRWNLFRDKSIVLNYIKDNKNKIIEESKTYRGIRNIFDENELFDWLENRKFYEIQEFRPKIKIAILKFLKKNPIEKIEDSNQLYQFTFKYLDTIVKTFFNENSAYSNIRIIHCPSMALDATNSNFKEFFNKVVIVVIDPKWGFGNMHLRNKISLKRYLERWFQVNNSSLNYLRKSSNAISIITSKDIDRNYLNARKVFEFLESPINIKNLNPSILGNTKNCIGYPYGGITSFKKSEIDKAYSLYSLHLNKNNNTLFEKCNSIYDDLKKISRKPVIVSQ
tara:strand:- start:1175 stop:2191 length:1017 start_codon:yes stop_codon:yes gene_type:complete